MKTGTCGRCGQPVWWATTPAGKSIPINTWTSKGGKIVALDPESDKPLVRFLKKDEAVPDGTKRYVSHFNTCKSRKKAKP